jgi:hypothetical protein
MITVGLIHWRVCRKDQLTQNQAPLRKRLKELQMELAQQIQLLTASEVPMHERLTALKQRQMSGRPQGTKAQWVGGSLAVKSGNATQKVACLLSTY